jgi:hypothetical protein
VRTLETSHIIHGNIILTINTDALFNRAINSIL